MSTELRTENANFATFSEQTMKDSLQIAGTPPTPEAVTPDDTATPPANPELVETPRVTKRQADKDSQVQHKTGKRSRGSSIAGKQFCQ